MTRMHGPLNTRLFNRFAAVALASAALNLSAGAAFAQLPPPLPPPPPLIFPGAKFVVTSVADTDDGVCDTNCTLREAVNAANANLGLPGLRLPDQISFQIPIEDPLLIQLQSPLPPLNDGVIVDGADQPTPVRTIINGREFVLQVPHPGNLEIHGRSSVPIGFNVPSNSTLRNLVLTGFPTTAVNLSGASAVLELLDVHGNGTGTTGGAGVTLAGSTATLRTSSLTQNSFGVVISGNQNTVSGNTITGNSGSGVQIRGGNTTLGGTTPAARNVISGNTNRGVEMTADAVNSRIVGNFIGTDATGATALANASDGIFSNSAHVNTIGGPTAAERNIISGNTGSGVRLVLQNAPAPTSTTLVQGNFIGTNAAGAAAVPNAAVGVRIEGFTGTGADTLSPHAKLVGNVLSGNLQGGVVINGGAGHIVQSNFIGTDASGTASIPNGADGQFHGVFIQDARGIVIGAASPSDPPSLGNVIAHNANSGITVFTSVSNSVAAVGNTIRLNSIFDNGRLGIDLAQPGEAGFGLVTPNDLSDSDAGANRLQNFPVVQAAVATSTGGLVVVGTLTSTPLTPFMVDMYASPSCDTRGAGEGQRFIGSAQVVTSSAASPGLGGTAVFTLSAVPNPAVTSGVVTATATALGTGDTSEFSTCLAVVGG